MKQCPRCRKNYEDDQLNFCLEDGALLTEVSRQRSAYADEAPPTVMLDQSRATDPVGLPSQMPAPPPAQWQQPGMQVLPQYLVVRSDQSLATISLCFGIASITIGWCCSSGLLFSPVALVTGFLALSNIKKDPNRYAGRGMALGGIITGIIYFALLVMIILLYGAAIIFGGLGSMH